MHPAWQIDDIRNLIFEFLSPLYLARLARTCKALFDLATDELWKTLKSVSPFMCCFPLGFRLQPLRVEDVQRLDLYARKVQNLILESQDLQYPIHLRSQYFPPKRQLKTSHGKSWENIWKDIASLRPASNFLSNLRRIRVSNADEALLTPLIGISGSNLTQIYIKYIHNRQTDSVMLRFLDQLQDTRKLEYLFVRDGEPDLVPLKLIQQSPLKQLRLDPRIHSQGSRNINFKQFPLRHEILQKPTLEKLTIGLTREWFGPGIEALGSKYLPALKTLWLNLTTFSPEQCKQPCLNITPDSWTCAGNGIESHLNTPATADCGRRPPTLFLEGLDNPELSLLNIKFPVGATGKMFLDVVSAANSSCRLSNLTELALAGGGDTSGYGAWGWTQDRRPEINSTDLRNALKIILPMPQLRLLRLSVAPNFLDVLDIQLYKSITDGLPALEKLWLSHPEFTTKVHVSGTRYYERVPLHHLAAFCSMLPNLVEVSMGAVDGLGLEESPRPEWASPKVKSLKVYSWAESFMVYSWAGTWRETDPENRTFSPDLLHLGLRTYFPNSDLAKKDFNPHR